jgi:hypothetical protein
VKFIVKAKPVAGGKAHDVGSLSGSMKDAAPAA